MDGIGKRLRYIIDKKGLTPYRVSKKTGVSQSTLSRILNKNSAPNESNLKALVDFLEVTEEWLLTGEESSSEKSDITKPNNNDDLKDKLIDSLELNVKSLNDQVDTLKKEIKGLESDNTRLKKELEQKTNHQQSISQHH